MAYVPGFRRDVFISYPMEAEAWTAQFDEDLKEALGLALSGKGLDTYFAKRNWELGQLSDEMLQEAHSAALFLVILTPGSLAESEARFLGLEVKAFRESGPIAGRFCPIPLKPVSAQDLSRLLPLENAHSFLNKNLTFFYMEDGVPLTLRPDSEPGLGAYRKQVEKVAWHLKNRLEEIRNRQEAAGKSERRGPFAGKAVLLGSMEPAVEREWGEIRDLLQNDGVQVLCAPVQNAVTAFAAPAQKPDLFVQLLSPLDATEQTETELRAVEGQNSVPILQWRRPMRPELLKSMDEDDQRLFDGPHVRVGPLEEFKREIREKLKELANPPPIIVKSEGPYLYITADKPDLRLARELQAVARKSAVADVMVEDEARRREDFEEGLRHASGVVFLYGDAKCRQFVELWLKEYVRKTRLLKIYPRLAALYQAPPKKNVDQEPMAPIELRKVGSQDEFTLAGIEQICAELRGDGS